MSTSTGAAEQSSGPTGIVAAVFMSGRWELTELDVDPTDLRRVTRALRDLRAEGPALGLACLEGEFFYLVRPAGDRARWFLSDATAAVDWDVAEDILSELDVELPDEDEAKDGPWPEGDLEILSDLGLGAFDLERIAEDEEAWADDQLLDIAGRLGFEDDLADIIDEWGFSDDGDEDED